MARVIVQALYNMPDLPAADHPSVTKMTARGTVKSLRRQHELAVRVLESTLRNYGAQNEARIALQLGM
jgi:hypothetical protein